MAGPADRPSPRCTRRLVDALDELPFDLRERVDLEPLEHSVRLSRAAVVDQPGHRPHPRRVIGPMMPIDLGERLIPPHAARWCARPMTRRRANARLYAWSSGGRSRPRGLRRGVAASPCGWQLVHPDVGQVAAEAHPCPAAAPASAESLSSVMSAVGPGALSATSTTWPVASSTATWALSVWRFFLPL